MCSSINTSPNKNHFFDFFVYALFCSSLQDSLGLLAIFLTFFVLLSLPTGPSSVAPGYSKTKERKRDVQFSAHSAFKMGNCGSVESGESPLKETIADHEAPINCMALSEDGTILVYYICLWDIFLEKYFSGSRIESPTNTYTSVNKSNSN